MRGVSQSGSPAKDITTAATDFTAEFTKTGEFRVGLLYEYYPLAKVNAVPSDATAFPRPIAGNILTMVFWDERSEDKLRRAREAVHELAGVLAHKPPTETEDSYGNYSE